ncbi:ABC transporter ATP-binding protein [Piscirickettsia litoralis]|uniref:ABC transporter family protein n=1 Tax=Piscirickettsia litoralis TaxID=1891921 RepID=A0ABX3ABN7_9GAMM|nr:ABC transporter ATP-binding protein [Piscirickettsia litoralis]ODN43529.1 ABC transporter family protein [Piscirickettsia litoralis]
MATKFELKSAPALEVDGLTKVYEKSDCALDQVSFSIEQGGFYALLGPNGAGKSTLINIITGLISKSSGTVRVFGFDLYQGANSKAKELIGLVPQEFNFNPFESVEHILYTQAGYYGLSKKEVCSKVEFYLKKLGLWEKRRQRARHLSGGMKRRLMIVRALLHEPKLLILDEPTAGVDIELRLLMWDFLKELHAQGKTIILTSHYFEEVENLCKHIIIINKGKLIENNAVDYLLKKEMKNNFLIELKSPKSFNLSSAGNKKYFDQLDFVKVDETRLRFFLDKEQTLNHLVNALSLQGIEIANITRESNTLENIFISLTQKDNKNVC